MSSRLHGELLARSACAGLVALALAACGGSGRDIQPPRADIPASQVETAAADDPCSLLEPREVEAVLGAPLATPPFLSRDGLPQQDGSACQYEDAAFHSIAVDVEWERGAMMFGMYGSLQGMADQRAKGLLHLADGSDLAGEWDEARVVGCCRFVALRGNQLVTVDVSGSRATVGSAAALANAALKRLDRPLPAAGLRNVKAAMTFERAHRPERRDPCALASRAEVEALIGALATDPRREEDRCEYESTGKGALTPVYVVKVRWTGGFGEFRELNETFGRFTQDMSRNMNLSGDLKKGFEESGAGGDLPSNPAWDVAHYNIAGLSAVKKDVLVSIEPQGGSADGALKIMQAVMSKL